VIASPVEVCFCTNDNAAPDELVVVTDLATAQEIDAIVRGERVSNTVGKAALAPAGPKVAADIESRPIVVLDSDWSVSCWRMGVGPGYGSAASECPPVASAKAPATKMCLSAHCICMLQIKKCRRLHPKYSGADGSNSGADRQLVVQLVICLTNI